MIVRLLYRDFKNGSQVIEYISASPQQYVLWAATGLQYLMHASGLNSAYIASLTAGDLATVGASTMAGYDVVKLLVADKPLVRACPKFDLKA